MPFVPVGRDLGKSFEMPFPTFTAGLLWISLRHALIPRNLHYSKERHILLY